MAYKKYKIALLFRVAILFFSLAALTYAISILDFKEDLPFTMVIITPLILITIVFLRNFFKFTIRRFNEMDDFFEGIVYP